MAISCAPLVTKRIWNCQAFRQEDQSRAGNSIHHAAILEAPFPWTCTSQCNLETAAECNGPRMCPSARCEVGGWWLSPGSIGSTGAALVAPYSFLKFPKDPKVLPCSNFEVFVKLFSAIPPSAQFPWAMAFGRGFNLTKREGISFTGNLPLLHPQVVSRPCFWSQREPHLFSLARNLLTSLAGESLD